MFSPIANSEAFQMSIYLEYPTHSLALKTPDHRIWIFWVKFRLNSQSFLRFMKRGRRETNSHLQFHGKLSICSRARLYRLEMC
jgi:hypothetical protein